MKKRETFRSGYGMLRSEFAMKIVHEDDCVLIVRMGSADELDYDYPPGYTKNEKGEVVEDYSKEGVWPAAVENSSRGLKRPLHNRRFRPGKHR